MIDIMSMGGMGSNLSVPFTEKVLFFGDLAPGQREILYSISQKVGIEFRLIENKDLNHPIGYYAGLADNVASLNLGKLDNIDVTEISKAGSNDNSKKSIMESSSPDADEIAFGLPFPMVVFCFLSDAKLSLILRKLREGFGNFFTYKAVLTPTNSQWTPLECLKELMAEHAQMHGR